MAHQRSGLPFDTRLLHGLVREVHNRRGILRSVIVIHGSAIPSGTELSIGYRQGTQNDTQTREISLTVIQAGAPLTCTSIPGNDGPDQHSR